MSGIEAVGVAFGVLPVLIEICKSYSYACDKLRTLRKYHKAVADIRLEFQVEEQVFKNECERLIRVALEGEQGLTEILQDPENNRWSHKDTRDRFRRILGNCYEVCEEVVIKIRDLLKGTAGELSHLSDTVDETQQHQPAVESFRYICHAVSLTFNESRYRHNLDDLRNWNAKFTLLRKQRCGIEKARKYSATTVLARRIPSKFALVREASRTLHSSISEAFTCSNPLHGRHQAKLLLDAETNFNTICLDMAISCCQKNFPPDKREIFELPIWLQVKSITDTIDSQENPSIGAWIAAPLQGNTSTSSPRKSKLKSARFAEGVRRWISERGNPGSNSRMNGRLGPLHAEEPQVAHPSDTPVDESYAILDIGRLQSLCCHFHQICNSHEERCLGFLEYQGSFRFLFFNSMKRTIRNSTQSRAGKELVPLSQVLSSLPSIRRLILAQKLATSVLQFYTTPWLLEDFHLRDILFLGDSQSTEDRLIQDLDTLHLSSQFSDDHDDAQNLPQEQADSTPTASPSKDIVARTVRYKFGIRNTTLASLGLALLEIGKGNNIASFNIGEEHEFIDARILADREDTALGPRYQRIVKKCINCNFSSADDLNSEDLRSAVYSHVVCELESLIEQHRNFLDSIS